MWIWADAVKTSFMHNVLNGLVFCKLFVSVQSNIWRRICHIPSKSGCFCMWKEMFGKDFRGCSESIFQIKKSLLEMCMWITELSLTSPYWQKFLHTRQLSFHYQAVLDDTNFILILTQNLTLFNCHLFIHVFCL